MRCLDEREAKLAALTANIKQSQDKSLPVRQTKLAYVDSFVKPPREIARKQVSRYFLEFVSLILLSGQNLLLTWWFWYAKW